MDKSVSASVSRDMTREVDGIVIDTPKLKKMSKKMQDKLNQEHNLDLKLSEVSEIISVSLGFRNFNELQRALRHSDEKGFNSISENKNLIPQSNYDIQDLSKKRLDKIFASPNLESLLKLFLTNDGWAYHSSCLISPVLKLLKNMRDNGEIIFNTDVVRDYLILDILIKASKRKDLDSSIIESLRNYLMILPGYQQNAIKQSETSVNHHGYLQMQFAKILLLLDKVKQNDFVLISKDWYFKNEDGFQYHDNIKNSPQYSDSWLNMTEITYCLWDLESSDKVDYYFTDLLMLFMRVINPEKINAVKYLIEGLSNQYEAASNLSEHFQNI